MVTLSRNLGIEEAADSVTTFTNKGQKPAQPVVKKCKKCDNSVKLEEEVCSQCFQQLNEQTTSDILLD